MALRHTHFFLYKARRDSQTEQNNFFVSSHSSHIVKHLMALAMSDESHESDESDESDESCPLPPTARCCTCAS